MDIVSWRVSERRLFVRLGCFQAVRSLNASVIMGHHHLTAGQYRKALCLWGAFRTSHIIFGHRPHAVSHIPTHTVTSDVSLPTSLGQCESLSTCDDWCQWHRLRCIHIPSSWKYFRKINISKARFGWVFGLLPGRLPSNTPIAGGLVAVKSFYDVEGMPNCDECFTGPGVFLCSDSCTYHECACALGLHICMYMLAVMHESINCDQTNICANAWLPPGRNQVRSNTQTLPHAHQPRVVDTPICIRFTRARIDIHRHTAYMDTYQFFIVWTCLNIYRFIHMAGEPLSIGEAPLGAPWSTGRIAEAEGIAGRRAANVPRCSGTLLMTLLMWLGYGAKTTCSRIRKIGWFFWMISFCRHRAKFFFAGICCYWCIYFTVCIWSMLAWCCREPAID